MPPARTADRTLAGAAEPHAPNEIVHIAAACDHETGQFIIERWAKAMGESVSVSAAKRVEGFISRWQGREGGQERANYALFLSELCDVLDVPRPEPASATTENNDYVFERLVREHQLDGTVSSRRIDLYKKGCFVLEAKQSRQKGGAKEIAGQSELFGADGSSPAQRGRGTTRSVVEGARGVTSRAAGTC